MINCRHPSLVSVSFLPLLIIPHIRRLGPNSVISRDWWSATCVLHDCGFVAACHAPDWALAITLWFRSGVRSTPTRQSDTCRWARYILLSGGHLFQLNRYRLRRILFEASLTKVRFLTVSTGGNFQKPWIFSFKIKFLFMSQIK